MEIEPDDFHLFCGDYSLYTLRCVRCRKPVTVAGSIGETLLHAPTAMLYHWNMIQFHDKQNQRELMLTPLPSPLMTIIEDHQNLFKYI